MGKRKKDAERPQPTERPLTVADAASELWTISTKLQGVGYLLKRVDGSGEPASSEQCYGIGTILTELGEQLDGIRTRIEG